MELYLVIVIVLFGLAISDLIVGVANDAVNFLNSAVGSKAASYKTIMIVASLGVFVGVAFSSGMMEVARKGIFNPGMFQFTEVMVIFLAVMFTDVLLLDLFNTFGLPTSTTVSLIFALIGSSVAVSVIKIVSGGEAIGELLNYINTGKALAIISGILISVVIAFSMSTIIQYLVRFVFTFDYEKRIRRYGAIWGGIAFSLIGYFILVKGAKGAIFLTEYHIQWINSNMGLILLYNFLFWAFLFQLLIFFTKVNIFKPIVLFGTFALALSFAANDLVNFIGVPLAGFSSYIIGVNSPNPFNMTMEALGEPVHVNNLFLFGAGIIMVLTLWISKKSRSVIKTELSLGRQSDGFERFESSALSRQIVRMSISLLEVIKSITPLRIQKFVNSRFDKEALKKNEKMQEKGISFDLLRASVILVTSSALISFGTSLKLPLSTTYVTFLVAMGASLSDRSWGRESAVYRVNGVITVIGGWFFTAFMAFMFSAVLATTIYFGKLPAVVGLVLLSLFFIYRTHILHKKRQKDEAEGEKAFQTSSLSSGSEIVKSNASEILSYIENVKKNLDGCFEGLLKGDRALLKESVKGAKQISRLSNNLVSNLFKEVRLLREDEIKEEKRYGKIIATVKDISENLKALSNRCFDHIDNNHSAPGKEQAEDINLLRKTVDDFFETAKLIVQKPAENSRKLIDEKNESVLKTIQKLDKNQVQRIKKNTNNARNSLLFLEILSDTGNITNSTEALSSSVCSNLKAIAK